MSSEKIRIVTHNAGFHADDVFGVATLMLLLGEESVEIIRTRDPEIINAGDYVLDVGFVYDPEKNRFDHHQNDGAEKRPNGIPYASFGLVWKKFGALICGSTEIAQDIETRLVQIVDAFDTGIELYTPTIPGVYPYPISVALLSFSLKGRSETGFYTEFLEAVAWAKTLLGKEVELARYRTEQFRAIRDAYVRAKGKSIIIFDIPDLSRELVQEVFQEYSEVRYFVHSRVDGMWQAVTAVDNIHFYKNRKDFPFAWGGRDYRELPEITGVADAVFCHKGLFLAAAKSKEGAIKLAELALNA